MSTYMVEVYYPAPADPAREEVLTAAAAALDGRLEYREEPEDGSGPVCLTYEFADRQQAGAAAEILRHARVHVEGPAEYGDAS